MRPTIKLVRARFLVAFLLVMTMTSGLLAQRIYWTAGNEIRSANLDGSLQQLHYTDANGIFKISIDPSDNTAFFLTFPGQGDAYRATLSTTTFTSPILMYSWGSMTAVLNLAHHPGDQDLYYNTFVDSDPGRIEYNAYSDMNTAPTNLNLAGYSGDIFHDIAIDTDLERVYVSNDVLGTIYYTGTFGGPMTAVISSGAGEAFDLNLGSREIIYEIPGSNQIAAVDMDSGTGASVLIGSGLTDIKAIAVHKSDGRIVILDGTTIKTANSDGSNLFQILSGLTGATDIAISECTYPTIQASAPTASSSSPTTIDLSWTNGNGNEVLVVAKQGSAVSANPTDGILHPANALFGSGDPLGGGNFVVYRSTGNSVTVSGLSPGTTYHFAIYSLNNFGACYRTPAVTTSATTLAQPSVQNISSSNTDATYGPGSAISIQATFDQAVTVSGTPRLLLETGTTDRYATYVSGSGTTTLTFQYTVQTGDVSTNLEYASTSALELNGGSIVATSDNTTTATLTLPALGSTGSLATNKNIVVDGVPPGIASITTSVDPITDTNAGGTFSITVTFDDNMNTGINPTITFPVEDPAATLTLNSVSWPSSTSYQAVYDVTDADEDLLNIDVSISSAQDAAGNDMPTSTQVDIFSINMCTLPTITTQPVSKTTCSNVATNFMITASGVTLTYQWEMDDGLGGGFAAISDGSRFTNTNTNQVSVNDPTGMDGYRFRCVVTENSSCSSTSNAVVLSVDPIPSTSSAGTDDTVCGTTYTLSGNTPTIGTGTWSVLSGPSGSAGLTFSNANDPAATVDINTPVVYGSYSLQWEITSGVCISSTSMVQITFKEPATANAGTATTVCGNSDFNISGVIGGAAILGHWEVVSGNGTFASSGSTIGSSLSGPNVNDTYQLGSGDAGTTVTLQLVAEDPDAMGPCTDITSQVDFTISAPPLVAPQTINLCSGTATGITLSATPGPVTSFNIADIRVPAQLSAGGSNATVGTGYSSTAISNDSYINTTSGDLTVEYDIIAVGSNPTNCTGPIETFFVTVTPEPVLSSSLSTSVCSDMPTGLTLGVASGSIAAGGGYHFINIAVPGGVVAGAGNASLGFGLPANALSNDSFTNTTTSSQVVQYTVSPISAAGCEGAPTNIQVTILPAPQVDATLANVSACSDAPLGLTLTTASSSVAATSFNITGISLDAGITAATGNAGTGTGFSANVITNDTFTNTTSAPANVTYTVVPVAGNGCSGSPFTITVQVSPANTGASASPASQTICSGTATSISLLGADSYSWTVSAPAGITGASSGSGSSISQTLQNTLTSAATVTYTITPVKNGCTGNPFTVAVSVNPLPKVFTLSGGGSLCQGETAPIILSGSQAGISYQLLRNSTTTVETMTGTGGVLNFTPQAIAGSYSVMAENTTTSCTSSMSGAISILVNTPPSSAALSGNAAICAGQSASLIVAITGGTGPYTVNIENVGVVNFTGAPIQVNPTATTTYFINSVVDANGCPAQSINAAQVIIQVDQAPTTATVGADAEVCEASFANLQGNAPSVGTGTWSVVTGTGVIDNPADPQSGVSNLQMGLNTFQWTISNGACSPSSATINITRLAPPAGVGIVESATGSNNFCNNDQGVTFNVTRINGASSYIWSLPDGFIPVSGSAETTDPSITVDLVDAQSGIIEVIGKNMCGSSPVSNGLNVIVSPAPEATIIAEETITSTLAAHFSFETTTPPDHVLWEFGDGETSTQLAPDHIYQLPGAYTLSLQLTNAQGCTTSKELSITVTGLEPISVGNIKNAITPNGDGANDYLTIENIENFPNNTVTLLDRWGVEVIKLESYKNDWDLTIDGNTIPAGNYLCIVQIQGNDHQESKVVTRTVTVVKGKSE